LPVSLPLPWRKIEGGGKKDTGKADRDCGREIKSTEKMSAKMDEEKNRSGRNCQANEKVEEEEK
jgi:hypothetical protein